MEAALIKGGAVAGAQWVVSKALSPLSDGLVELWAASTELEPNIDALKTELLCAQGILNRALRVEIDNPALAVLLQKLRDLGYEAENALGELDYFRIQDEIDGSSEAVEDLGCGRNLVRVVRHVAGAAARQLSCDDESCKCARRLTSGARNTAHVASAAAKQFCCASCLPAARGSDEDSDEESDKESDQEYSCKCGRRLASRARTATRAFGKRLLCSSPLSVTDDSKLAPSRVPKLKFDRVGVSKRMKCIADKLKPLRESVSDILLIELQGSDHGIVNSASGNRPTTTSGPLEHIVYGRDQQKNTIVVDITNVENIHRDLTVIPIVGPGGIGKTTLTQYIYNSKRVEEHFQIRVWVCVSLDFSVYKLTREIVSSIPKAEDEKNDRPDNEVQNLDQLQKLIEKRLKNRRFLLVLDDIWKYGNEDEWNRLLVPFKKVQGNGDIILITTRFLEVAEMVKKGDELLQLEGLEPKEYWSLFVAYVFGETNRQYIDKNLLEIGEKIVEKLKGSPLAAKTVGSLLRKNPTVVIWTRVLESREWELQTGDNDIMPALKLSYDYLPFHLQQCFSFCALFPEDYKFESEELIHFWIGLDILHPGHTTKRIEDVGCHNLNDLVNYGFFKKETDDLGTHYVMHDLLHDLALNVSSQECLHIASSSLRDLGIAPSVYHMSISCIDPGDSTDGVVQENFRKGLDKIRNIIKFENLRTLMLFGNYDPSFVPIFSDLFKNANSLRVVFLSTMYYPVESLLLSVPNLVHLRYLRLESRYGSNEHLPRNISRFYQLRVLDIRKWHNSHSLLGDMTNLVKLRHFLSHNEEVHSNICNVGKLYSLQQLQRFEVKKESSGFELRELGKLEDLGGSLAIYNLDNAAVNEAHEAKLSYKYRLHKLTLNWKEDRSDINPGAEDQQLESLRPHTSIHELSIDGHGGSTCPTWLGTNLSTRGLEALRLDNTDWESLPPLGELYMVHETGEEYFGCIRGPSFPNLKRLELIGLPRFRRWVANEFCPWYFSIIEILIVKDCPKLTTLPFSSYTTCYPPDGDLNVTWFPRLKEIEIENCPELLSLPPTPYSHTLCNVTLQHVGRGLELLSYSNKSSVPLEMEGNDALPSLDETVLAFDKLTHLQELSFENCPPLSNKHLQMLTSLKTLKISKSGIVFLPLVKSDVKWQLPVTRLEIMSWTASGQELTRLLSHLPDLSHLEICLCDKITLLNVEAASLSVPASSGVKLQDTHGTNQQKDEVLQVEEEVVAAEQEEENDGLLLLPAQLPVSLKYFIILGCPELILTAHTHGAGGGGLHAMRSIQKIEIKSCPKFLSAYKDSDLCPFPSSLQRLVLEDRMEGMDTLVPLSNLTSLQELRVTYWGQHLRHEGLLHLLTQGQLTILEVRHIPNFFAGWDPARGLQGGEEQPSSKLQEFETDDIAGALAQPICRLLAPSLTRLSLEFNEQVERFTEQQEEALSLLTSLKELQFWWCEKLRCLPSGLRKLTSLERLQIYVCPAMRSLRRNGLPSSLQELVVEYCINLRCLPAGLHKLTSLKRLEIERCPAIRSLPKNGLPSSLQELDVRYCHNEKLKQRCRRLVGTIPLIRLG
ncbi:uncharacterized protein [Lolium perenne]|uniref:uncharacterized protein n=1 Tax=Lolium perenne TaxID=4522 RepID=UPI0021F510CA|nr:putative disease resistance protein RGA4 [Lolium perenne]XP_051230226.1 putative disease resistance protein RGA4 [Lolium perenne]XP_051230231.1 putative disease resistance protein RGA4 [Lolium perenne]XP_051230235.1 putative disease resistance protein RGA4 [Lolium perenne]XP_051230242.1 putative disease resistance protein RGA4 [Lolium perenne]XP_051230246.1 putative disease resistance protein RGA4 [Lolium perenne]XP_051230250.1 putative disease resistance protein RGA4 [Lolium perenne]XP_0